MTTRMQKRKNRLSEIKKSYFNWLWRKIEDREADSDYKEFLYDLHQIEFYSILPNDDNRAMDGVLLRGRFQDKKNLDDSDIKVIQEGPCTIFEMLVALADRMGFLLDDIGRGNEHCEKWFWLFIENLDLLKYVNDSSEKGWKRETNSLIIRKFLEREYSQNGKGGLFPLKRPKSNQKSIEIWYQMMQYISENYSDRF